MLVVSSDQLYDLYATWFHLFPRSVSSTLLLYNPSTYLVNRNLNKNVPDVLLKRYGASEEGGWLITQNLLQG